MFAPTFCFFAFFFSISFYELKCTIKKIKNKSQPPTETTPGSDIEQTNNKLNNTTTTIPQTQSYTNAIQSLINNTNVRVKIADLGNACYEVSYYYSFLFS